MCRSAIFYIRFCHNIQETQERIDWKLGAHQTKYLVTCYPSDADPLMLTFVTCFVLSLAFACYRNIFITTFHGLSV